MKTIAVLGAAGRTGRLVIERALAKGLTVRALARTPSKLGELAGKIEIVQGDATEEAALGQLVAGVDAVVSTLGGASIRESGIHSRVMPPLMRAMKAAGVKRYVGLSSSAAELPSDEPGFFARAVLGVGKVFLTGYAADKAAEVRALTENDLEWTLVRPGGALVDGADGELRVDLKKPSVASTRRAAVATMIVRALTDRLWIRQGPFVSGP